MAVARTSSPKTDPHSLKALFEVTTMAPFPYLLEIVWKTRLASSRAICR